MQRPTQALAQLHRTVGRQALSCRMRGHRRPPTADTPAASSIDHGLQQLIPGGSAPDEAKDRHGGVGLWPSPLLAQPALAQNPHLKGRNPVAFPDNILTLTATVSYAGLGNFDTLQVLDATAQPTADCVNPGTGEHRPPGQNPAGVDVTGSRLHRPRRDRRPRPQERGSPGTRSTTPRPATRSGMRSRPRSSTSTMKRSPDQPVDPSPQPDPWHSTVADFQVRDVIDGTVTKASSTSARSCAFAMGSGPDPHQRYIPPARRPSGGRRPRGPVAQGLKIISLDSSAIAWGTGLKQAEEPPGPPRASRVRPLPSGPSPPSAGRAPSAVTR